ncbi:MAG TPA: glycosyltransferase family 2 protein [Terriglobia bacterium]|nr:glycosyltransferase family 2 protein [Terriglobia bacterium]
MPLSLKVFLALGALLLGQGVVSLRGGYRFLRYLRRSLRTAPPDFHPPAAVMVPVKGLDPGLIASLDSLLSQDYPHFLLIVAVAIEEDPAYDYLKARLGSYRPQTGAGPRETRLVVAGLTPERGEKVNNLLAALRLVPAEVEVLVFADADGRPRAGWLRALVGPLQDPAVTVSTGFRWYLPGSTLASRLRAAWDTSIATLLGDRRNPFAWGGSMAIRRAEFERLQVAERYWAAAVSDDYALTRAVRDAGGWIRFEPKCIVPSFEPITFMAFLRWTNRQIVITRVYARHLWAWGLASHALFCGTMLLGLAAMISPARAADRLLALAIEAAILTLGIAKARLRERAAQQALPQEAGLLQRYGRSYWRLWPLVPWIMLINFVTAGWTKRIEWRGTCYELISPTELRVLKPNE